MDFELSHEQRLLGDIVERCLSDNQGQPAGVTWRALAALGALGAGFSEADGGFGGDGVDRMVIMQSLGRAGCALPYLSTVVMAGRAIALAGTDAQKAETIPPLVAGELRLAFAHDEPQSRYRLASVRMRAVPDGHGFVLDGVKAPVPQGQHADVVLVTARVDGDEEDESGLALFALPSHRAGIRRQAWTTQDGQGAASLVFTGVHASPGDVIGTPGQAWPVIQAVTDAGIAATCAEALGAMERAHALTMEYLATRTQFGQAIGRFQALQHRAVDMVVALELARSMVLFAAAMADDDDVQARGRAMSAAKIRVARSARLIAQEAIQMHGAIGLTEEYALSRPVRRLTLFEAQFGGVDHHAARLLAAGPPGPGHLI